MLPRFEFAFHVPIQEYYTARMSRVTVLIRLYVLKKKDPDSMLKQMLFCV